MKQLSKSKYAKYCQCPKCLWMSVYKPEEEEIDPTSEARFENGAEVGELARGVLGYICYGEDLGEVGRCNVALKSG